MNRPKPGGWMKLDTGKRIGSRKIETTVSKRIFHFHPALIDRNLGIQSGRCVRMVKLHGCPPPGTMGHYHIGDADTGEFLGMVAYGSLRGEG